jgi:hypothetical protein
VYVPNVTGESYSVINTAGSTYAWMITGGTQATGTNTNSITVDWGASGTGNVQVIETNAAGCAGARSFTVTVTDIAPVISNCPSNITQSADANSCGAHVSWPPLTVTDNCDPSPSLTSSRQSGDLFPIGETEVIYTAKDNKGNTSTCKFKVIVEDKSPPVFSNYITKNSARADATCQATVTWAVPTVRDNCEIATVTSSHRPGDSFRVGTTNITYIAADIYGNKSSVTLNVEVKDENPPVISGCPADMVLKTDESGQAIADWTPPTAFSVCGEVSLTGTHKPGSIFSIGRTVVEYTASDDASNTSVCTFTIDVSYEDLVFDVSKVITPDGDGINDVWLLPNLREI